MDEVQKVKRGRKKGVVGKATPIMAPGMEHLLPDMPSQSLIPSSGVVPALINKGLHSRAPATLSRVSQATVVYLLTQALGRGCYFEAARCAAALLPEARTYPRTVTAACSQLFRQAAHDHPTSARAHQKSLLAVQRLVLDGERAFLEERLRPSSRTLQTSRLVDVLCGLPPEQMTPQWPYSVSGVRLESATVRACAAARSLAVSMLQFPGCPPLLQQAEALLSEILTSLRDFRCDPRLHALHGLTLFLQCQAKVREETVQEEEESEEGINFSSSKRQRREEGRRGLALLPLWSPIPPTTPTSYPAPPRFFSQGAARLLQGAERSLKRAVSIIENCVRLARSRLVKRFGDSAAMRGMSEREKDHAVSTLVFPWVEPLAGIPFLLQRVLEFAGRVEEGTQVIVNFLVVTTTDGAKKEEREEEEEEEEE